MSADELPMVCSLSAPDLSQRLAEIAAIGNDALLDARDDGRHAELRFAAEDGVRERVEAIVAAEAQCCAFAVAGGPIGGWLGIACAVIVASGLGLILLRRTRRRGGCR